MATLVEQRLARLHGRRTLYELVIERGTDHYLVQYTARTRSGLVRGIRKHGAIIEARFGPTLEFAARGPEGRIGEWRIYFSGRTEREAIGHGELPRAWEVTG